MDRRAGCAQGGGAYADQVGRYAFQHAGAQMRLPCRQRRAVGRGAAGGLRREIPRADGHDAPAQRLSPRFGLPVCQCADLCFVPYRCDASGVAEQAHQGAAADGAGHRAAYLRHSGHFDSDGRVADAAADQSGRFGGGADADIPRQYPGLRVGHPALGQRHAQGRRLDFGAQVRRRRHGGGGVAHDGQNP